MNSIFYLPDFSFWTSSVGRRIHNNGIIMIAPADFPFYEFYAVINKPADRSVCKSGGGSVFFCPGNHALGSVYMGNACAGSGSGQSRASCVGKKIQYFYRSSGIADFFPKPVPVYRLFRKKSGVFEAEGFQVEGEMLIMKIPLLGKIKKLPFSAAFFASVIMGVHIFPAPAYLWGIPDNLRVRTDQDIFSPAFQFFSAGGVNYFIFFPLICNPHK